MTTLYQMADAQDVNLDEIIVNYFDDIVLIRSLNILVAVKQEFLDRFDSRDNVLVGGNPLNPQWGSIRHPTILPAGQYWVEFAHNSGLPLDRPGLGGYRWCIVPGSGDEQLRTDIEAALNYVRRIEITAERISK